MVSSEFRCRMKHEKSSLCLDHRRYISVSVRLHRCGATTLLLLHDGGGIHGIAVMAGVRRPLVDAAGLCLVLFDPPSLFYCLIIHSSGNRPENTSDLK